MSTSSNFLLVSDKLFEILHQQSISFMTDFDSIIIRTMRDAVYGFDGIKPMKIDIRCFASSR